jgi:hypothetical protein
VSGSDSESVTKGDVSTSNSSSWSWTRSGTVWDDGRNNWIEGWSKSSWKDGRRVWDESDTTRGSFDPKGTGTQTNNLPEFGSAPQLNKQPKNRQIDLNKPPKRKPQPSKDFFEPIAYDKEPNILPDPNQFAGSGAPPPEKWPPQDIGSYWLSYTGTLNTTPQQTRQIFRDIIKNPSINKVYINVLSAFGVTFSPTRLDVNMISGLKGQDVFKSLKKSSINTIAVGL